MYKVTVIYPNGTQATEASQDPDYYSLSRALDKCEIHSIHRLTTNKTLTMDLNAIIRSDNAQSVQLVVNAKDLRDLLDGAMDFAMKTIIERDEPTYYSRKELEQLLHVSAPTIMSYRRKGLLPEPVIIDGRVLYDKAKVREALYRNTRLLMKTVNDKTA